ncbi:actinia tenebrosa protease inhibitors-like [Mustelus asterias]
MELQLFTVICSILLLAPQFGIVQTDPGKCRGYFEIYCYNQFTESCEKFIYGGCGGNANNFGTLTECKRKCEPAEHHDICKLPKRTGHCKASFKHFYYNQFTKSCEKFIYGGCGGNANNFGTLRECKKKCEPAEYICSFKILMEAGKQLLLNFCYQLQVSLVHIVITPSGMSKPITFKCSPQRVSHILVVCCVLHDLTQQRGNILEEEDQANSSEEEASQENMEDKAKVKETCKLPQDKGICKGQFHHYYYNQRTKACEPFIYGGCGGNANNFINLDLCLMHCEPNKFFQNPQFRICCCGMLGTHDAPGIVTGDRKTMKMKEVPAAPERMIIKIQSKKSVSKKSKDEK